MFKENDNMRPGPTPERVLAICRLLENNSYNQGELYKLSQLSDDPTSEEAVNHSIQVAKELDLIREENEKYVLAVTPSSLESAKSFRRMIAPVIFARSNSTFFKLTEWFIANSDKVLELTKFDEYAAEASKAGLESVTENDVLGWRFWMRFLGHAYQYNRTLIPNMKIRLEDAMVGLPKETHMTCTQFVLWLKEHVPEAAASCSETTLPLAVSNGLRTLQNEGKIEIIAIKDAIRTGLFPLRGVDKNDFSDIVIKEVS
ncbi:MAG TPA: hypothetical protein IAA07_11520 [Candidatus Lachnoclostridium stercoravium]|uniref:Uncharacterized protein n=1 Tax=Candidatus Lachnoclostridium stercoravium TaxID=2838633 RepID=A0A9D2HKW7_9FIRM|nr:hypothetical protein [Candidatus Lachnoclostridium stercoravium]